MFETDAAVFARAVPADVRGNLLEASFVPADPTPHSIFFLYMRLNSDGTFEARQYYHHGNDDPIDPSPDNPTNPNTLGYYVKDMALNARKEGSAYPVHGYGVDINFPQRFSYCVYFMDDLHWRFLTEGNHLPVVYFKTRKNGQIYKDHPHAFRRLPLVEMEMPNRWTTVGKDIRQAAVMINRMHDEHGVRLGDGVRERFCFEFPMRVRYGSTTDGLTLIIDPTGTNLGPPEPPPAV